jgi:D-glycero-alpha-D-manno-heptose-7-phosphate kinase
MIITQAPLRVSFFGGGTDFPEHFREHGGAVLATAIDRSAFVTVQPFNHRFFDHGLRIAYRRTEAPRSAAEVQQPAIRACLQKLGINEGIELHHMADLPARTGLGSSSSFIVAMLQALHAYAGRVCAPGDLAREAIEVERVILGEAGGYQDQILAAVGGTCYVRFDRGGSFAVSQVPLSVDRVAELDRSFLLVYTGIQRDSVGLQQVHVERVAINSKALCEMAAMAQQGATLLAGRAPLEEFGRLLHDGWMLKRQLGAVSLPDIDAAYETGRRAGAWGGKLLGAGQGGFLVFVADPASHASIRHALGDKIAITVGINAPGSRVIFAQGPR